RTRGAQMAGYAGLIVKRRAWSMSLRDGVLGVYEYENPGWKSTGQNLWDGEWHHVGFTFLNDGDTDTHVFIDGVKVLETEMEVEGDNINVFIGSGQDENNTTNPK